MRPSFAGTACLPLLLAAVEPPRSAPVASPPPAPAARPAPRADDPCPQCAALTIPAIVRGTTRDSRREHVDRWPCAAEVPEDGPEVWYSFRLDAPRLVRASIVEDPLDGIDVDLHLLTTPGPSGCFARDDERVEAHLPAGTWFLVVDTCASTGRPLPGRYELTLQVLGSPE